MIHRLWLLLLLVLTLAGAASGDTETLIWQQTEGGRDTWGPSQVSREPLLPIESELADDFDLTGSVTAISVGGLNGHIGSPNFPPPFYGVNVRFYAFGPDGKPGALQAEYFQEAGAPGLEVDHAVPNRFRVALEPPFAAEGRHFVSVQPVIDPVFQARWYWWSANSGAPRGSGAWFRDLLAEDPGWTRQLYYGEMHTDLSMTLYGSRVTPVPRLIQLSDPVLPRAGRLKITGEGFGFHQENSVVRIGSAEALVTHWSDNSITAYVPETAPLGSTEVVVVTAGGEGAALPLEVVTRPSDGRVRWRFQADGPAVYSRPAVGPDGTLYAGDHRGHLYALAPDGALKWIYSAAPAHCAQSLAVGSDGTVYMAAYGTLISVGPDGRERWRVKEPTDGIIFAGPSIGPDGNIYAVGSDLPGQGLGLFSVSPQGALRWSSPGFRDFGGAYWGDGQEIVFAGNQLYFSSQSALVAYTLDGTFRWSRPGVGQAAISPDGSVYVQASPPAGQTGRVTEYGPDGSARGSFSSARQAPVAGPDGTVYALESDRLAAFDSARRQRWELPVPTRTFAPEVSPFNTLLVVPGQTVFEAECFLAGVSIAGTSLWRLTLPMEAGAPVLPVSRPRFSADAETAYVGMTGNQYVRGEASWLYAVATAPEPGTELPFLSVQPARVGGGSPAGGVVTLPEPAGPGGVTVQLSSSSASASVPANVTVRPGLRSVAFTVSTRAVERLTEVVLTASLGGMSHTAPLTVAPPGPVSVELERWAAGGGESFSGTVSLNGPAPAGGLRVALQSSHAVVRVPGSVTVPAGQTTASFPVTAASPTEDREVEITASANGLSASAILWVWPVWLEDLFLSPDPVVGGSHVEGTLVLSGPAPEEGLTVYLETDKPDLLALPASVLIPEGEFIIRFTAQTQGVAEPTFADVWAYTRDDELGTWIDILPSEAQDQVDVQTAATSNSGAQLTVEATSTAADGLAAAARRLRKPALTVYDTRTGKAIGKLKHVRKNEYRGRFKVRIRPDRVTVRSSRGGASTRVVSGR
ncbi:MAG: PQQ-binding-like beta-propeller repeat protein [Armatimonadota bacterium]